MVDIPTTNTLENKLESTRHSFLSRLRDLYDRHYKSRHAEHIKEDAQKYVLAWVPADNPPAGSVCIRGEQPCLQRMVDPLADPDKEHPEEEQEGVGVCNRLHLEDESTDCTGCPEYYEYVIPVFYFEAGQQFIHNTPRENE